MASLSTVYAITTVISSIAGMGAAFLGNRIFPLTGGSQPIPPTPSEVEEATRLAADKAKKLADAESIPKTQVAQSISESNEDTTIANS